MLYSEDKRAGNRYREEYLKSVEKVIQTRGMQAAAERKSIMDGIAANPEIHREKLRQMLGWPLNEDVSRAFSAKEEFIAKDELCSIYRVTIELEIGLKTYGILMLPNGVLNPRIALVQHGGAGCPELLIGLWRQANYNDMPRRILRRGMAVYAPQLLLWNSEDLECATYDRYALDAKLKQLGGSITALEVFSLTAAIDYLHERDDIDCSEFAMVGLSYGGFYTLFTSALDLRIKRAYSSCFFNDRLRYSQPDWSWFNSSYTLFDEQVAALIAPRRLYIEVADKDEVFACDSAAPLAERVHEVYSKLGCEREFSFNVFSGYHEFSKEDRGLEFILRGL